MKRRQLLTGLFTLPLLRNLSFAHASTKQLPLASTPWFLPPPQKPDWLALKAYFTYQERVRTLTHLFATADNQWPVITHGEMLNHRTMPQITCDTDFFQLLVDDGYTNRPTEANRLYYLRPEIITSLICPIQDDKQHLYCVWRMAFTVSGIEKKQVITFAGIHACTWYFIDYRDKA